MSAAGSFWARRRAGVEAEAEAERLAAEADVARVREESYAEKDDATLLAELNLPDPSTMQDGDDFSVFMAREVPERFRRIALRKLWRSNPVLACVDGLNEYDDDYTIGMTGQVVKTAYQVGRGMMAHVEEMERQKEAALAEAEGPGSDELAEEEKAEAVFADEPEAETAAEDQGVAAAAEAGADPEEGAFAQAAAPRRRMAFRFEEAGA
ncbi:DUF3306 domain-containing protein [uncultured Roseobacter sp.]|uniref:DUF3306 domain-containing protein n=1 Tax=uncultured Roseobacter sp. TaxID=114847 RepID=UPI0026301388|nr:DUF3306 domain-containing protein [uncultured Roseobacter sp.]